MSSIKYIGCFFDKNSISEHANQQSKDRLFRIIEHPHTTFSYKPNTIPFEFFGQKIRVRVIGYGRDNENEGFKVEFEELPAGLIPLANQIKIPHITISVSENGQAVNSNNLTYKPIDPFYLTGVFGGEDEDGFLHIDINRTSILHKPD